MLEEFIFPYTNATISHSQIFSNEAGSQGGAIRATNSSSTILNYVLVDKNKASSSTCGIKYEQGHHQINNSTIVYNSGPNCNYGINFYRWINFKK